MFSSRYMPCSECGESIDLTAVADHECDRDRRLDHQMFALQEEIDGFEGRVREYLRTDAGRFEVWLAARLVRQRRP